MKKLVVATLGLATLLSLLTAPMQSEAASVQRSTTEVAQMEAQASARRKLPFSYSGNGEIDNFTYQTKVLKAKRGKVHVTATLTFTAPHSSVLGPLEGVIRLTHKGDTVKSASFKDGKVDATWKVKGKKGKKTGYRIEVSASPTPEQIATNAAYGWHTSGTVVYNK